MLCHTTALKMSETWCVTLSQYTYLIASWKSVRIVVFHKPRHMRPSATGTYANFCSPLFAFLSLWIINFLYARLHSQSGKLPHPPPHPPNPVFKNSLHRQFIHVIYVVSRWSTGNRGRATSASEVIEVAGSNQAIGVILNLAWGPNDFSPSMIWSWQTRSISQTGLGAE